jgi:hypothetical protein
MVEHVSTGEKQYGNQADCRPNVPILDDRHEIWPRNTQERYRSQYGCGDGNTTYPIDRSVDLGVWSVRKVPGDPGMDLLCRLRTVLQSA